MTPKALASILSEHGKAKNEGSVYTMPDGTTVTLYSSLGSDSLTIEAKQLRLDDQLIASQGTEVFVLAYEDVRALRFTSRRRGTGYGA